MKSFWSELRLAFAENLMDWTLDILPSGPNKIEYQRSMRIYDRRSKAALKKETAGPKESAQLPLEEKVDA